ncbi:MAG: M14 metallopeptidase family protein [Bacteroidota bacterium]
MRNSLLLFGLVLGLSFSLNAQIDLSYYLDASFSYDPNVPTPQQVLGFEVGEWHVRHDQQLRYMETLAKLSPRMKIDTLGYSHELRPIVHLSVSSPANIERLEEIRVEHVKLVSGEKTERSPKELPMVLWMGYSIHGNEPSGGNAALLSAYHLAAAQGPEIDEILANMVILLDPCYNPDGFNRFASWANTHKGIKVVNTDPNSREHNEVWPRGRTNHYWFDLNRDWLLVRHPESQARIAQFHHWKPNLLTDHHEMGTNSTFFFQPGVPSRNHPLTPEATFELHNELATYHAKALDEIGSLYYTKESFDDFYYGKGSTYPDINGAVGILFEQASSRGHAQTRNDGTVLTFPFTIRNQFRTSLSTIEGAFNMRGAFLQHQAEFYRSAKQEAKADPIKAYIFSAPEDSRRAAELASLINQHDIDLYHPQNDITSSGKSYSADESFIIPLDQAQYRLIKAMFERRTSFTDSLFYDVSAWTLPLAFNLQDAALSAGELRAAGLAERLTSIAYYEGEIVGETEPYAYVFGWENYYAPRLLNQLMEAGLKLKVANKAFRSAAGKDFAIGSILLPVSGQNLSATEIRSLLQIGAKENSIDVYGLSSGHTQGVSLGSNSFAYIKPKKILLMTGDNVSSYEAGEVWHLLDQRYEIDATHLETNDFGKVKLSDYDVIIMPNGNYSKISAHTAKLSTWLAEGGTIVAWKNALNWLHTQGLANFEFKRRTQKQDPDLPYAGKSNRSGAQVIGGAIMEARLDLTHPLAYGYRSETLALFKNSSVILSPSNKAYINPLKYSEEPLLSGYLSEANAQTLSGAAAAQIVKRGRGRIVALADNPNFRAFWYGTNRLMINGIYFGSMMN